MDYNDDLSVAGGSLAGGGVKGRFSNPTNPHPNPNPNTKDTDKRLKYKATVRRPNAKLDQDQEGGGERGRLGLMDVVDNDNASAGTQAGRQAG